MKKALCSILLLVIGIGLSASSFAQAYPWTTPTYIPNAVGAQATQLASGVPVTFISNNISTLAARVSGTCTSMVAAIQGTNDATNWTTLVFHSVGTGTSGFGTAASSITGDTFVRAGAAGFTQVRLNVTGLNNASSVGCVTTMTGTQAGGTGNLE